MSRGTRIAAVAGALLAGIGTASAARAADWTPVPLPPPPGGMFSVPAGPVGDLSFWAPNRGVMTVAGNSAVPGGVYSWDGMSWHQLATVCPGGPGSRIVWAGPTEFWTITAASIGDPRIGAALCRFKDGAVVGSYSMYNVPELTSNSLTAGACRAADDCVFGGPGGSQAGAFHLRWDGTTLRPLRGRQGRGVSDMVTHRGTIVESVVTGVRIAQRGTAPLLTDPEPVPRLLHHWTGGTFANDPFEPTPSGAAPVDGTDLRGLDSDGTTAWAVGGGANSGPATTAGPVKRPPIAVRKDGDGAWTEVPLSGDVPADTAGSYPTIFGAVAAVPGTRQAWVTLTENELGQGVGAVPTVAHVADDGRLTAQALDDRTGPAARGAAAAIACPAVDDCWLATASGYLYRRTTAGAYPRDTDPAFQGTISIRPNEAAEQVIPDDPPADDSRLLAPPVELPTVDEQQPIVCAARPRLVTRTKASRGPMTARQRRQANPRLTLTVRFRLARRAKVGLQARRKGRVVARAATKSFRPGTRKLTLNVRRKQWPTGMKFVLKELTKATCSASTSDTVSTGSDS